MKLRRFTRSSRRRAQIDAVLTAYLTWQRECAEVRSAYGAWKRAAKVDASAAFVTYRLALDREERAALTYARLIPPVRYRPELDLARQLSQLQVPSGPR